MSEKANSVRIISDGARRVVRVHFQFPLPDLGGILKRRVTLLLYFVAVCLAVYGNARLGTGDFRTEENALHVGAPYLWLAFFTWLLADLYDCWADIKAWWKGRDRLEKARWLGRAPPLLIGLSGAMLLVEAMSAERAAAVGLVQSSLGIFALAALIWAGIDIAIWRLRKRSIELLRPPGGGASPEPRQSADEPQAGRPLIDRLNRSFWRKMPWLRIALPLLAAISSAVVWAETDGNRIAPAIVLLWLLSALLWAWAFAPLNWSVIGWARERRAALRRFKWRENAWIIIAMILVMILGAGFRFAQLDTVPSEMINDHVINIHDAYDVYRGEYKIFFEYGGREPAFIWLTALLARLPGFGFDYYTVKFLAALESLISLPIFFAFGVELIGGGRRKLGVLTGLLLAGLVAASFWHVVISRLALRIVPAPLFTALVMIYLSRALRRNRRVDFVMAGLALGFGLYTYSSVRALPIIVAAGVVIALLIRRIAWRERLRYLLHLAVLAAVTFMICIPLFHFAIEKPDVFWQRATSRSAGHDASIDDWRDQSELNIPIVLNNIRNALLMFNWRSDGSWVQSLPAEPALDVFTGAFLVLGAAAWLPRMLRSRDPAWWLAPVALFIMLLPSVAAVAFPTENPSNTRASGVIPLVYLLAAFPLALIARRIARSFPRNMGFMLAAILCGGIILLANHRNTGAYFDRFADNYRETSYYRFNHAGRTLRGFANSDGAYGNAFVIHYSYHWHNRGIGIEAGQLTWPNAVELGHIPDFLLEASLRHDAFQLDPARDLLFFYRTADESILPQLREWFPAGREMLMNAGLEGKSYKIYRVPALGGEGFARFVAQTGRVQG